MRFARLFVFALLSALLLIGGVAAQESEELTTVKQEFVETYAAIVLASYEDSLELAVELNEAIDTFLTEPSEETLEAARAAWLAAQEPYGQTEAYRFYGGPIDDEDGPEGLLNAWPLDEAYVDYVEGAPDAGIINNVEDYPEITRELLIDLNENGAEENISTGYHAIEFLLWGQDLSSDGNGNRPYTDYTEAPNAERRAQYLDIVSDLLVEHLESLIADWQPDGEDNYYATFVALEPDAAIQNILTGIGVLAKSELAGERMFTAWDNQDQEDEHSCFSDNTHRDIVTNFIGIQNVYLGSYSRLDGSVIEGAGLADVVENVDPELNARILELLDLADTQVTEIYVPFDQAIIRPDARPQVFETVNTLLDLGDSFADVALALGIPINTALPE